MKCYFEHTPCIAKHHKALPNAHIMQYTPGQGLSLLLLETLYSKTCLKRPLKKNTKIGFQDRLSLNAGQKYSAILSTFIKLPFAFKTFVLSILSGRLRQVLL